MAVLLFVFSAKPVTSDPRLSVPNTANIFKFKLESLQSVKQLAATCPTGSFVRGDWKNRTKFAALY